MSSPRVRKIADRIQVIVAEMLERRITPLVTMQPAMLPIFDERKIARISAWPRVDSSYSGLSMPLRAASISSIAW